MNEDNGQPTAPAQVPALIDQQTKIARGQANPTLSNFVGVAADDVLNKMWSFSERICNSIFVPQVARGDAASVFYLCAKGHDLGIPWTTALDKFFLTPNGKVGMEGSIILALLLDKKFQVKIKESSEEAAEYWIKRPKSEGEDAFEWSKRVTYEEALKNGWPLTKSDGIKPPWKDRANMLRWRSLAIVGRVVAADVIGGICLPDELADFVEMQPSGEGYKAAPTEHELADKKAEDDPGYAVVIEAKPEPEKPKEQPKAELKPEPKPEPQAVDPEVITDEDVPAVNTDKPPAPPDDNSRLRDVLSGIAKTIVNNANNVQGHKPGTKISLVSIQEFVVAWNGKSRDQVAGDYRLYEAPINRLQEYIREWKDQAYIELFADPTGFGKRLKKEAKGTQKAAKATPDASGAISKAFPDWGDHEHALAHICIAKKQMRDEDDFVNRVKSFSAPLVPGPELKAMLTLLAVSLDASVIQRAAYSGERTMLEAIAIIEQEIGEKLTIDTDPAKVVAVTGAVLNHLRSPKMSLFDQL